MYWWFVCFMFWNSVLWVTVRVRFLVLVEFEASSLSGCFLGSRLLSILSSLSGLLISVRHLDTVSFIDIFPDSQKFLRAICSRVPVTTYFKIPSPVLYIASPFNHSCSVHKTKAVTHEYGYCRIRRRRSRPRASIFLRSENEHVKFLCRRWKSKKDEDIIKSDNKH